MEADKEWHAFLLDPHFKQEGGAGGGGRRCNAPAWHSNRHARQSHSLQTQALGHHLTTHLPALSLQQQHRVSPTVWLSTGEPIEVSLRNKFGANAPALMQRVVGAGRQDGVQFADWKWRANTVKGA